MSSEVHHRADSEYVPACVSTGRSDMVFAIIGVASLILNVVPAANKDAAAHNWDSRHAKMRKLLTDVTLPEQQ
uniref:Uncharacterized protein n=1 Tax=Tanacetum cinerariifolium TaxID=118510 RepID=A0A6L2M8E0_TANCI|nr:hypothetical protein [Tanacetum cinerariifolium]